MAGGKHQFDACGRPGGTVDSELVFGQDRAEIERVFPSMAPGRRSPMRARLLAVALLVVASLLVVPGLARGDGPERPAPRVHYVVQPGDTLWSIARQVAPGRDPRPVVDALVEANDLHGGLQVGQELTVPVPPR
jgi:nucleoid-associated protein YgaU